MIMPKPVEVDDETLRRWGLSSEIFVDCVAYDNDAKGIVKHMHWMDRVEVAIGLAFLAGLSLGTTVIWDLLKVAR